MKRSYLIWAIAGLLASCSNEDLGVGLKVDNHVVHASFEQLIPKSRVGFDGDNGYAFFWTKDDELSVYTTNVSNPWAEHTIVEGGVGKATADFTGTLIGEGTKTSTCAVYPFNEMHSLSGSTLSFYMPDSYTYTGNDDDFGQTNNATNVPMLAKIENEGSKDFAFKHLGGMFAFKIANIPAGANKFVFTVDKKINGSFNVDLNADEPVIVATETTVDDERTVTINFPASETIATRVFYIPVPTTAEGDSYGRFSVSLYKNQTEMWSFISSVTTSNVVTRKKLLYAPVLACSTVSGGEGVDSEEELRLALASSEGMGSVILSGSFALENELEISSGKNIAIDLNNQTLTVGNGASTFSGRAAATTGPVGIKNSGTLTLKNGTISGTSMQNIIANLEDAELRLENVTITHTWEQGYVSYTYSDGNEHAAILNKKGVVELINVNITSDLACVYTIGDWDNNGGSLDDQRAAGQTVKTIIEGGTMSSTANYAHTGGNKHTYAVQAIDNALTTIANVRISGEGGVSLNCSDAELTNAVFSVANCTGNDTYGLYLYSAGKMSWDETCNLGIVKAQIYNDKGAYKSADGSVIVNDVTINEQTEGVVTGAFGGKTWDTGVATE